MNVYLVSRTDNVSWCEDIESIVVAKDELWAEKLARLNSDYFRKAPLRVKKVDLTQEGVLLTTNTGA